jgi:hypothetical protein
MDKAMEALQAKFNLTIPEYTVAAIEENGNYLHRWYLGKNSGNADERSVRDFLDGFLMENNKNYEVARSKALKSIEVKIVPDNIFIAFSESQKKKGGQTKFPRVMKAEPFEKWEEFVQER